LLGALKARQAVTFSDPRSFYLPPREIPCRDGDPLRIAPLPSAAEYVAIGMLVLLWTRI
jgi:hypothetical protein